MRTRKNRIYEIVHMNHANTKELNECFRAYANDCPIESLVDDIEVAMTEDVYFDDILHDVFGGDSLSMEAAHNGVIEGLKKVEHGTPNTIEGMHFIVSEFSRLLSLNDYPHDTFEAFGVWDSVADFYFIGKIDRDLLAESLQNEFINA